MIIIGVVGQIASGKGTLVKYLTEKLDFVSFSLSSIVHDELKKKGVKEFTLRVGGFTRKTLQDMGDELRKKEGDDVLARRAIKELLAQGEKHVVIEGIRNPGEIRFFKKSPNFILVGVKANRGLRFKRLLSRRKSWDPKNWTDFVKVDRRDLGVNQDKSGQQVGKCLTYCDYMLTNNKDLKDFQRKVEKLFMQKLFPSGFIIK